MRTGTSMPVILHRLLFTCALLMFSASCGSGSELGDEVSSVTSSGSDAVANDVALDNDASEPTAVANDVALDSDSPSASIIEASEPAEDSGPIIISHKFGETVVPRDPQRVVSLGVSDQDDLLALGIIPVGILDWFGNQPFAVWPWAQDLLGDAEPVVIPSVEPSPELIASLSPDLIVAVSSGLTKNQYETLSQLAPTVASPAGYDDWSAPWQVRTRLIGEIFDQTDETEAMIAQVEGRLAEIRADNPVFDGATAAVAFTFNNQPGAYTSADVRAQIMESMGFITPPAYDELALNGFYVSFSEERIDLLDTDVVIWLTPLSSLEAVIESPIRKGLSAVTEGREVFISVEAGGALSFASPLSLNYVLDEIVPELQLALDGDPSTVVPSANAAGAVG